MDLNTQKNLAVELVKRLGENAKLCFLTEESTSWYIHVPGHKPAPDAKTFQAQWQLHPEDFHVIKIAGKDVYQSRFSQSWGHSYSYSGTVASARDLSQEDPEAAMVRGLVNYVNKLVAGLLPCHYNGCLQNWYLPEHKIGLHADDETDLREGFPIFSLSWGGPRRFLFRSKENRRDVTELLLQDGDLLVMGGTCQQTHKHEVPKVRKTMDPPAEERINWTIRAFRERSSSDRDE